jgi:hypothetical protein
MILPDPTMFQDWKDWARQVIMVLEEQEREILHLREQLNLPGPV